MSDRKPPVPESESPRPRRRRRRRSPGAVAIQTDPNDTTGEILTPIQRLIDEAKKAVSGLFGSVGVHALLVLLLLFITAPRGTQIFGGGGGGGMEVNFDLTDDERAGEDVPVLVERNPIHDVKQAPASAKKTAKKKKVGTSTGKPVGKGPVPQPVKPVNVKGLFQIRKPEVRARILEEIDPEEKIRRAIASGLRWLKRRQRTGGNWQLHAGYPDPGYEHLKTDTGATALALLVFLGDGHTHKKKGIYQETVRKGIKWLLGVQKTDGDFHDGVELGRQTAFYAHSQATIAICEAYAMTKDDSLKEPSERAIGFLVRSQNPLKGGWKYQPQADTSRGDLSVTGWALMALHTARAAEIPVSPEAFDLASRFLDSVEEQNGSRYKYEPPPTPRVVTPTMTAEGLLCRQFLGWPRKHQPLIDGVNYLLIEKHQPRWEARGSTGTHVYFWYYAGHVLHNMGSKHWKDWYQKTAALIVAQQKTIGTRKHDVRGTWDVKDKNKVYYDHAQIGGRMYITTMCLLVLQLPLRHQALYETEEAKDASP